MVGNSQGFRKWLLGFLMLGASSSGVWAETIVLFDFDGVIVETRADRLEGAVGFPTRFKLFRNFKRATPLQPVPEGPEVVWATAAELEAMQFDLSRGDGKPGSLSKEFQLSSGVKIIPGEYHLRTPDSYEEFHEGRGGRNHLLEAFQLAEKTDPSGKTWKGPAWESMVMLLSTVETARTFGLLSARGHSRDEWAQFFFYLKKKGYIKFLPEMDHVFSVSRPEFDRFDTHYNSVHQKRNLLEQFSLQLARKPLTHLDLRKDSEGRGYQESHYLIFVDDRPEIIEAVAHLFRTLATGRIVPVKFGLFNAGTAEEVKALGRPQFTIVTSYGQYRPALPDEIFGELKAFKSGRFARECAKKLKAWRQI